jgi:hypothetical protein
MAAIFNTAHDANARDPAYQAAAVTPSNTVDLTYVSTALWIGGAGNIAVVMAGGPTASPVTFIGVPVGTYLPIRVSRVMSTNTTATNIVALWR